MLSLPGGGGGAGGLGGATELRCGGSGGAGGLDRGGCLGGACGGGGAESPLVKVTLFEAIWAPRRGTGGGGFFFSAAPAPSTTSTLCFASRTKFWIKSLFCSIMSAVTPRSSRSRTSESHDSSTLLLVNPFSSSYPTCATCWNEPCLGAEIIDLSTFPPFLTFFGSEETLVAKKRDEHTGLCGSDVLAYLCPLCEL